MIIHNPENKWNIIPKVFSMFPLFAALALLHGEHAIYKVLSAAFFALTIYTFGFTKYERYLDTDKKVTVKRIRWLFIKTETIESISNFEAVVIALGGSLPNSNWQSITTSATYDIVLVRKHASSRTHTGLGAFDNFLLFALVEDINEAKEMAVNIGEQLGLPVEAEKQVIKLLKYDPVNTVAF